MRGFILYLDPFETYSYVLKYQCDFSTNRTGGARFQTSEARCCCCFCCWLWLLVESLLLLLVYVFVFVAIVGWLCVVVAQHSDHTTLTNCGLRDDIRNHCSADIESNCVILIHT